MPPAELAAKAVEPLVYSTDGRLELAPLRIAWLYGVLASSALVVWFPPSPSVAASSAALTVLTLCAGHSVGLHRGLIHRTYRAPRWLERGLTYLFVHTGIGGPQSWIQLHYVRDHYQNERECPRYFRYDHSLARDYFWNLHLCFIPRDRARYAIPEAYARDRWLTFLERTWAAHIVLVGAAIWAIFGPHAAITLVPLRVAVSVLGHWFIGYRAHRQGEVRYALDGSAEIGRNLPVLGVLSFGEGFHNNHHANPGSARMGEARYELDLGWLLLLGLERMGLVHQLRATGRTENVRRENARNVTPRPPAYGAMKL